MVGPIQMAAAALVWLAAGQAPTPGPTSLPTPPPATPPRRAPASANDAAPDAPPVSAPGQTVPPAAQAAPPEVVAPAK